MLQKKEIPLQSSTPEDCWLHVSLRCSFGKSASLSALAWWSVKWVHGLNWLKRSLIPGEGERWRSWEPSSSRRVTPAEKRPLGALTSSFPSPFLPLCLFAFLTLFLPLCLSLPTSVSFCLSLRVSFSVLTASWSRAVGRTSRRDAHSCWAKKRGRRQRPASARGRAWRAELPVGPGMAGGFRWAQDGD